jgi:hypothetical protein
MATAFAQEARDAMAAPEQVEEAPDADSVFAKLKDLKPEGESPEDTGSGEAGTEDAGSEDSGSEDTESEGADSSK